MQRFSIPCALLGALLCLPAFAQSSLPPSHSDCQQGLVTSAGDTGFARSLADETMFVNDFGPPTSGLLIPGVVRRYDVDGGVWSLAETIEHPDAPSVDFGGQVAAGGNLLVVTDRSEFFIYTRSGTVWTLADRIAPPGFLFRIATDGERIAVSHGSFDNPNVSIYHEVAGQWELDGSVVLSDDPALPEVQLDFFSAGLTLEGEHVAVGARISDVGSVSSAGAVVHLRRSAAGWLQEEVLISSAPGHSHQFGLNVAFGADTCVITQLGADGPIAYSIDPSGVLVEEGPIAPVVGPAPLFGRGAAIDGDRLLVTSTNPSASGMVLGGGPPGGVLFHQYRRRAGSWLPQLTFEADGLDFTSHVQLEGNLTLGLSVLSFPTTRHYHLLRAPSGVFVDEGGGLAGQGGMPPMLRGSCPGVGLAFQLTVEGVRPNSMGLLLVNDGVHTGPLLGSTLSPVTPYVAIEAFVSDANGRTEVPVGSLPPGTYLGQSFSLDSDSITGVSISNALRLDVLVP